MAEWFQVLNVIRDKCVDPATEAERRATYRALLDAHPEHFDAIVLTAQQRDGIIIEFAQNLSTPVAESAPGQAVPDVTSDAPPSTPIEVVCPSCGVPLRSPAEPSAEPVAE